MSRAVRVRRRGRVVLLALLAVVALLAGCRESGSDATPARQHATDRRSATSTTVGSTTTTSTTVPADAVPDRQVALVKIPVVAVFDNAGDARPTRLMTNPTHEGYRLSFLVLDSRPDGWLHVNVPVRPNGTTGWIQAVDTDLALVRSKIVIDVGAHRLRYWDNGQQVLDEPIAVGTQYTPTPTGSFFVDVVAKPPNPRGPYGPYQVSITAFSNVLERFGGGIGQLAIHGTNHPELIGSNVSNGCIRVRNDAITILAERVAIGTPVEIRA